jgi:hypothetical protein
LEDDSENAVYYSARLLYAGQPIDQITHPGTPIYYLAYLIMLVSGPDFEAVQHFFDLSHFAVSVLTAAALCALVWMLLEDFAIGVSVLALASIVTWPSFLTYLDYFEGDSFVVAFGLPTIAIFWSNLENGQSPNKIKLLLCGIGLGLCLATKLGFVPVGVALFVACSIQVVRSRIANAEKWTALLMLPMGAALTFLVFPAPIFGRLPNTILITLYRPDTRPPSWDVPGSFLKTFGLLLKVSLSLTVLIIAATLAFLYLIATRVYRHMMASQNAESYRVAGREVFDYVSGGVFLSLMLLSFVYTMAASARGGGNPGMLLKNVYPSALVFPFLILYCYRLFSLNGPSMNINGPGIQASLFVAGLVMSALAVSVHVDLRREFIEFHKLKIPKTRERLEELRQPGTRIAFWDGTPGDLLGDVSFHFLGQLQVR